MRVRQTRASARPSEAALLPVADRHKARLSVQDGDQQPKLVDRERRRQTFGQTESTPRLRPRRLALLDRERAKQVGSSTNTKAPESQPDLRS